MKQIVVASALAASVALFVPARALADGGGFTLPPLPEVKPLVFTQADAFVHPNSAEGENGFSFARFRLGAWSYVAPWAFALATFDFAKPEVPTIVDGFVTIMPNDSWGITAGYSRNPLFVSARTELEGTTPFPELSMPVKGLWPGRDVGVEVRYAPHKLPIEAWFRIGNGSTSPLTNDNGAFELSGRLDAVLGRGAPHDFKDHTYGLRVGIGAYTDDTEDRAGVDGEIANGYAFYQPPVVSDRRSIVEAHALVLAGPVRLLAEMGAAREDRTFDNDGNPNTPRVFVDPVVSRGGAIEVGWMITSEHRVPGVWPKARDNDGLFDFRHVAVEVAGRVERLDLGRDARGVAPGGGSGAGGVATAWVSSFLSFSVAGYVYGYDTGPLEEPTTTKSWLLQSRLTLYINPPPPPVVRDR